MFFILLPVMLIAWKLVPASADVEYLLGKDEHDLIFTSLKLNNTDVNKNEYICPEMSNGTLTELVMFQKDLLEFPPCLPRKLTSLDLSHNSLRVIEVQKILDLSELQILVLSHNAIEQLNWTGAVLNTLQRLDLGYNLLSSVPACHSMPELQWLSLAGNPLLKISPLAFSCFPSLRSLDLARSLYTTIGGGIEESAFAVKATNGIAMKKMDNLTELDLSRTFLTNIQQEWTKDLPNLRKLTISQMPFLESLKIEAFKNMPLLKELICKGSSALSWTEPKIFQHTPQLEILDFQNCNLSNFDRWHVNSSTIPRIILIGNPLKCSCELSWLLSGTERVTLISANETTCNRTEGRSSASLSLPELYKECQTSEKATLPATEYQSYTSTSYEGGDSSTHTSTHAPITTQEGSTVSTTYITVPSTATTLQAHHSTMGDQNISVSTDSSSALVSVPTVRTALSFEGGASHVSSTISSSEMGPTNQHATTQVNAIKKRSTIPHIPREYVSDIDYEEEEEEKTTAPHEITVCDYHPCRHLQKPCHEIQRVSMCYCPGLSADNVVPDPPRLRKVSEITDTSVQIHWCAPNSVVQRYQLVYQQEGSENLTIIDNIYVTAREYPLYNLSPDTTYQVCVITINKAGPSQTMPTLFSRIPCTKFKTRPSYIVILATLCATSGILLLAIIILSACLYKQRKNTFVEKYDTHLVSYKNPAFDYSTKLQPFN